MSSYNINAFTNASQEGFGSRQGRNWPEESTVDHPGNAVVKTLTLSLDARESNGCQADCTQQTIKVGFAWRKQRPSNETLNPERQTVNAER